MAIDLNQHKKSSDSLAINITSLMDVLTIILVFLLVNYSNEAEKESPPSYVKMPGIVGTTLMLPHEAIVVNIGRDRLVINDVDQWFAGIPEELDVNEQFEPGSEAEENHRLQVETLYEDNVEVILTFFENRIKTILETRKEGDDPPVLTIQADKYVPYDLIKEIIKIGAYYGVTQVEMVGLRVED